MADLIDRQAAIDICANAIDLWHGQLGEGALVAVRDKIAELPPAEPKIIRCKNCKWNRTENRKETTQWLPCRALVTPDDFSCICAERKDNG